MLLVTLQKKVTWTKGKLTKNYEFWSSYKKYRTGQYKYDSNVNYDKCCEYCGANHDDTVYTELTVAGKHSDGGTCSCYRSGGYIQGAWYVDVQQCIKSEVTVRAKREVAVNDAAKAAEKKDDAEKEKSEKIAQDLVVTCVGYDGGKRGYWDYDYTLPHSCWSKKYLHMNNFLSSLLGVNCSRDELPDILVDRPDVIRPTWDNQSLYYQIEIE